MNSFHYIENDLTYDKNRQEESFIEESKLLYKKYSEGHTIIVKNLEHFNENIRKKAAELGPYVDVHMYLTPKSAEASFPYHTDKRDVLIHMIYGEKTFALKKENEEEMHALKANDELFLPKQYAHKAIPNGASCLLSFGMKELNNYSIPTEFSENDFL